jgi:hypothetical protein
VVSRKESSLTIAPGKAEWFFTACVIHAFNKKALSQDRALGAAGCDQNTTPWLRR